MLLLRRHEVPDGSNDCDQNNDHKPCWNGMGSFPDGLGIVDSVKSGTNEIAYAFLEDEAGECTATTNVREPEKQTGLRRGESPVL